MSADERHLTVLVAAATAAPSWHLYSFTLFSPVQMGKVHARGFGPVNSTDNTTREEVTLFLWSASR